jgi:hypothetical protein
MLRGRASGDGIFIWFRRSDVTVFLRPRSVLAVAKCFAGVCTVFISKKSIVHPRELRFIPSSDGTHGVEDYGILRLSLFSTGAYLYSCMYGISEDTILFSAFFKCS